MSEPTSNETAAAPVSSEEFAGLNEALAGPQRQSILVTNRGLDAIYSDAQQALAVTNDPPVVFRHGGVLVRVGQGDDAQPIIQRYQAAGLKVHLAQIADWVTSTRNGASAPTAPTADVVHALIERADELTELPVIDQVVRCPIFAPNGTLVTTAGYSAAARVWYEPDPMLIIAAVSDWPTTDEVVRARDLILGDLLVDFPFVSEADRALALSLTLLPFVRPLIPGPTPLHVITAPTPGTGKGLCAQAALLPGFGANLAAIPEITDEAEMIKQLGTVFMAGRPLVRFDNVRARVDSASLSLALTEPVWQKRILGVNRDLEMPIRCIWVMAGNNIELSSEMGRRSPHIELDVTRRTADVNVAEHPWRRSGFKHQDLIGWASAHRGELVWACLTIVRSWQVAGQRSWSGRPLGSYGDWSRTMGGLIEHVGITQFLANLEQTYDRAVTDRERECEFVEKWASQYGVDTVVEAATLSYLSMTCGDPFGLNASSTRAQATTFGMAMQRLSGQVRCGWQIERATRRSCWVLRRLIEQSGAT